jgi:hypothetical protein
MMAMMGFDVKLCGEVAEILEMAESKSIFKDNLKLAGEIFLGLVGLPKHKMGWIQSRLTGFFL